MILPRATLLTALDVRDQNLKLKYDEELSNLACNHNLRRYMKALEGDSVNDELSAMKAKMLGGGAMVGWCMLTLG